MVAIPVLGVASASSTIALAPASTPSGVGTSTISRTRDRRRGLAEQLADLDAL